MSPRLKPVPPPPPPPAPVRAPRPLLRIDDVADRLAVSRSMAWKLMSLGEIKSIRVGRAVRVRESDLDAYIDGLEGLS